MMPLELPPAIGVSRRAFIGAEVTVEGGQDAERRGPIGRVLLQFDASHDLAFSDQRGE
jgi:hypothetical protein